MQLALIAALVIVDLVGVHLGAFVTFLLLLGQFGSIGFMQSIILMLHFTHRDSRVPILAAARAWHDGSPDESAR